jgi:hypothetical protein
MGAGQHSFKQVNQIFRVSFEFEFAYFSECKAGLRIRRLAHIARLTIGQGSGLQMVYRNVSHPIMPFIRNPDPIPPRR